MCEGIAAYPLSLISFLLKLNYNFAARCKRQLNISGFAVLAECVVNVLPDLVIQMRRHAFEQLFELQAQNHADRFRF